MSLSNSELRDKISQAISFAIQGVQELPKGTVESYYKGRADWVNVETDKVVDLFEQELAAARIDENNACQNIIKGKWGTNDQLWDMQDRIKRLRHQTNKPSEEIES